MNLQRLRIYVTGFIYRAHAHGQQMKPSICTIQNECVLVKADMYRGCEKLSACKTPDNFFLYVSHYISLSTVFSSK